MYFFILNGLLYIFLKFRIQNHWILHVQNAKFLNIILLEKLIELIMKAIMREKVV